MEKHPDKLRRIRYFDGDGVTLFVVLTYKTDLEAAVIAYLYKTHREVESIFKWMKQHEGIESFRGASLIAVKIQIYCAIIATCHVAIMGNKLKVNRPLCEIMQVLSISLLNKTPVRELLTKCDGKDAKAQKKNGL